MGLSRLVRDLDVMLCCKFITFLCDNVGMECSFSDVDWILVFLGGLLEKHLINAVSNRNSSNAS